MPEGCIHHIRLHLDSMVENKLLSKANEGHPSGLAACLEAHRKCDSTISKLRDVISQQRREIRSLQEQAKPRRNLTPNANSGLKRKRVDDIDDHEPGSWDHSARARAESALKASQADAARIRIVMDELGLFLPGRSGINLSLVQVRVKMLTKSPSQSLSAMFLFPSTIACPTQFYERGSYEPYHRALSHNFYLVR